jgi:hypothetical protein
MLFVFTTVCTDFYPCPAYSRKSKSLALGLRTASNESNPDRLDGNLRTAPPGSLFSTPSATGGGAGFNTP